MPMTSMSTYVHIGPMSVSYLDIIELAVLENNVHF